MSTALRATASTLDVTSSCSAAAAAANCEVYGVVSFSTPRVDAVRRGLLCFASYSATRESSRWSRGSQVSLAAAQPVRPNTVLRLALQQPLTDDIVDPPRVSGRVVAICGAPVGLGQLFLDRSPALLHDIARAQPFVEADLPALEMDLQFVLAAFPTLGHDLGSIPGASFVTCEHILAHTDCRHGVASGKVANVQTPRWGGDDVSQTGAKCRIVDDGVVDFGLFSCIACLAAWQNPIEPGLQQPPAALWRGPSLARAQLQHPEHA